MWKYFLIFIACLQLSILAYEKPPGLDQSIWEECSIYFLPEDHPAKPLLDEIFKKRVSLNKKTLLKAGFTNGSSGPFSHTVITTHPKLGGYFIKLFRDDQPEMIDYELLPYRVAGSHYLRKAIKKFGFQEDFKVPKKWLYPLPVNPPPPEGYSRKYFVVIAEDAEIVNDKTNKKIWKSSIVTKTLLNKLYIILDDQGLYDSTFYKNIPFAKDGRIAFVDTEMHHRWPIYYAKLARELSRENRAYWLWLIRQGGPLGKKHSRSQTNVECELPIPKQLLLRSCEGYSAFQD